MIITSTNCKLAMIHFYSNMANVEIMSDDSLATGSNQVEIDIEESIIYIYTVISQRVKKQRNKYIFLARLKQFLKSAMIILLRK